MADVKFDIEAENSDAVRGFRQVQREQKKTERNQKQMNRSASRGAKNSKKNTDSWNQSLKRLGRSALTIATAGGGFMVLYKVINKIRNEIDQVQYRQKQIAEHGLSMQEARYQAMKNMPSSMTAPDLDELVSGVSEASNAKKKNMYKLASSALSARGQVGDEGFRRAMTLGGQLLARGEESGTAKTIVGGILDMMKATGSDSAKGAFGFMREFGTMTRMTDVAKQSKALGQVSAAAPGLGASIEQGAELAAYMTQVGTDVKGRLATTGSINFMEALANKKITDKQFQADTFTGRLSAVQEAYQSGDKEQRAEILKKIGGAAKMKGPIMSLLREEPEAMKAYQTAQQGIGAPTSRANIQRTRAFLKDTLSGKYGKMQKLSQLFETSTESMLDASPNYLSGIIRDRLEKMLKRTPGISDESEKVAIREFEMRTAFGTRKDVIQHTLNVLEGLQQVERMGEKTVSNIRGTSDSGGVGALYGPGATLLDEAYVRLGLMDRTRENPDYMPDVNARINRMKEGLRQLQEVEVDSQAKGVEVKVKNNGTEQRVRNGGSNGIE